MYAETGEPDFADTICFLGLETYVFINIYKHFCQNGCVFKQMP